jgi:hypothetical protein
MRTFVLLAAAALLPGSTTSECARIQQFLTLLVSSGALTLEESAGTAPLAYALTLTERWSVAGLQLLLRTLQLRLDREVDAMLSARVESASAAAGGTVALLRGRSAIALMVRGFVECVQRVGVEQPGGTAAAPVALPTISSSWSLHGARFVLAVEAMAAVSGGGDGDMAMNDVSSEETLTAAARDRLMDQLVALALECVDSMAKARPPAHAVRRSRAHASFLLFRSLLMFFAGLQAEVLLRALAAEPVTDQAAKLALLVRQKLAPAAQK